MTLWIVCVVRALRLGFRVAGVSRLEIIGRRCYLRRRTKDVNDTSKVYARHESLCLTVHLIWADLLVSKSVAVVVVVPLLSQIPDNLAVSQFALIPK